MSRMPAPSHTASAARPAPSPVVLGARTDGGLQRASRRYAALRRHARGAGRLLCASGGTVTSPRAQALTMWREAPSSRASCASFQPIASRQARRRPMEGGTETMRPMPQPPAAFCELARG
jgi:hypothetical protein